MKIESKKIVVGHTPSSFAPSGLQRKVHFIAMSALAFSVAIIGSPLILASMAGCYAYFSLQRALKGEISAKNREFQEAPPGAKRIHFITSCGGGAHNSLMTAIQKYWQESDFSKQYPVQFDTSLAFGDVFKEFDLIRKITCQKYSGEDFFNYLNRHKMNFVITLIYYLSQNLLLIRRKSVASWAIDYFEKHKPSLVISTTPLMNFALVDALKKTDTPLIIVPADPHPEHYIRGVDRTYLQQKLVITSSNLKIMEEMRQSGFSDEQLLQSQFPVRPDFLKPCVGAEEVERLRKKWGIPEGKKVVTLLMGGGGSTALIDYAKALCSCKEEIAVLALVGKSDSLIPQLKNIQTPENVQIQPIGFLDPNTPDMCEIMDITNIFITKSGPNSLEEAKARMRLGSKELKHILIDYLDEVQNWEKENIDLAVNQGMGTPVTRLKQVPQFVHHFLNTENGPAPFMATDSLPPPSTSITRAMQYYLDRNATAPLG